VTVRAFETTVDLPVDDADRAVREALGTQGFGVLTEIDVAATLKAKLGLERPALRILGACNPGFASRALERDPSVALLLPCNVVLEDTGAGTRISVVDPRALIDDERFADLADEAAAMLQAAVDALAPGS
jgi:uncharacterized protein (DUF302 family)